MVYAQMRCAVCQRQNFLVSVGQLDNSLDRFTGNIDSINDKQTLNQSLWNVYPCVRREMRVMV